MHLERIEQTLAGNNKLLWLLFNRQGSNEGRDFFSCLPFGQLTKTFLTSPYTGVNDLQEKLTGSRIKDEDCTVQLVSRYKDKWMYNDLPVDRLCCQVTLECLVNRDTIDICIINEQLGLIAEQFGVILRIQELLRAFRSIQL